MTIIRNFEPASQWSNPDGTPTPRALGWMRSISDFIGATFGTIPSGSLGGDGSTTTFYRGDGTFAIPSYPVGADPNGAAGLTPVVGSALTFMRSDAAPQISQSIVPTWTGAHTFTQTTTMAAVNLTSLVSTNSATIGAGFGCNGKAAQTAAPVNTAIAATAGAAYTAAEQGMLNDLKAIVNQMRSAFLANGTLNDAPTDQIFAQDMVLQFEVEDEDFGFSS